MRMNLRSRRSAGSGHRIFVLVAAWGITSVVGLVIVNTVMAKSDPSLPMKARDENTKALPIRPAVRGNDQVLFGGRKTTLADAERAVGYPVLLPDAMAAMQADLTQVWVNSQRGVGLVFDGKITITMAPATYKDPTRKFRTYITQNRYVEATIGSVHGQPALVITPDTDYYKSNPAWVEFYSNGIDINISSHSYGTATLLAVANSMH